MTLIDGEKVIGNWLRGHSEIVSLSARVVGKTPNETSAPWVKITQLDAENAAVSPREHLIEYWLQADCYAGSEGGQPEANRLGYATRSVLASLQGQTYQGATVTSVQCSGPQRVADTDFEPARDRTIVTARVHLHA